MPKIVDKEARRRDFARAALLEFQQRGYPETKIEDIAARAGAGKGTVYEYFRDGKREIVLYLFEDFFARAVDGARNAPIFADDPAEDCVALLMSLARPPAELLPLIPVYFEIWASRRPGSALGLDKRMAGVFDELAAFVAQRLGRRHGPGGRPRAADRSFARMIVACIDGMILHRAIFHRDQDVYSKELRGFEAMLRAWLGL